MKKLLYLFAIIAAIILSSGCGNDLKVTVYNASGVEQVLGQFIAIDANTESHDQWFDAQTSASSSDNLDSTNSFVFTAKESETLKVAANGQYLAEATGNTIPTMTTFTVPVTTQLLYGGFLDNPNWYAAVNLQSVIIYKK